MRNAANYYVEPKATSVAVALLPAKIKPDLTADLNQVYVDPDPQAYPLSSYSYMVIPKDTTANFNTEKGRTQCHNPTVAPYGGNLLPKTPRSPTRATPGRSVLPPLAGRLGRRRQPKPPPSPIPSTPTPGAGEGIC
ncbi:MAG TPA: hypothetical protein VHY21_20260 [Pseudonocardiaceae bacterium]|nr:hypothetical protein [Pseudonocardiaceae bacterium]